MCCTKIPCSNQGLLLRSSFLCILFCWSDTSIALMLTWADLLLSALRQQHWEVVQRARAPPALVFRLQRYLLDQWNCLMWTYVSPANILLKGLIAPNKKAKVCFKSHRLQAGSAGSIHSLLTQCHAHYVSGWVKSLPSLPWKVVGLWLINNCNRF